MTVRFFRRVSLFPGVRLNLSMSGVSVSVGRPGAWLTTGKRGMQATLGLPGTGLFWTKRLDRRREAATPSPRTRWTPWFWIGVAFSLALWTLIIGGIF